MLQWLAPRSAAVRSLRLRASDSSGRKDLVSPVSWAQFVPLLNNITNEHDRQLVARKMQPLLMAAWAEPEYPDVQHDYTRSVTCLHCCASNMLSVCITNQHQAMHCNAQSKHERMAYTFKLCMIRVASLLSPMLESAAVILGSTTSRCNLSAFGT